MVKDNEAQNTHLSMMRTDVMRLSKESAAQHANITTVKAEVDHLKKENAAQDSRLAAGEAEVEDLKASNAALEAEVAETKTRLATTETQVENLDKNITETPKVAFSAALTKSGYTEAGNKDLNLVFTSVLTNVGQAYSGTTGFFTAPVKGVYYFRFNVMDILSTRWMYIKMFKNETQVMFLGEYDSNGSWSYLSSGVTLLLEEGDVVNIRLPVGYRIYGNADNHNIFSGFLLFAL